jgi:hypothetical protein
MQREPMAEIIADADRQRSMPALCEHVDVAGAFGLIAQLQSSEQIKNTLASL